MIVEKDDDWPFKSNTYERRNVTKRKWSYIESRNAKACRAYRLRQQEKEKSLSKRKRSA